MCGIYYSIMCTSHPDLVSFLFCSPIILQVNEKFFELKKGHIGIVEKVQETSSDTGMHNRAITVLHEQWMYLGSRDTPTSQCLTW